MHKQNRWKETKDRRKQTRREDSQELRGLQELVTSEILGVLEHEEEIQVANENANQLLPAPVWWWNGVVGGVRKMNNQRIFSRVLGRSMEYGIVTMKESVDIKQA